MLFVDYPRLLSTEGQPIHGLTSLGRQLFVIRKKASYIEVYDIKTLKLLRLLTVNGLTTPQNIASCEETNTLFISDTITTLTSHIFTLKFHSNNFTQNDFYIWAQIRAQGLSVNTASNILVTLADANEIREYTRTGELIDTIILQKNIASPQHAIEISDGEYIVSHGSDNDPVRRVCLVDSTGKMFKSFGGAKGPLKSQQYQPLYLSLALLPDDSILVADFNNNLVMRLDAALNHQQTVASSANGLNGPYRLLYDEEGQEVFVADNSYNSEGEAVSGNVKHITVER